MCAYVPLLSTFLIWKGVPIFHTSAEPDPLPHLSALYLQLSVPPLQPLDVRSPPPRPLSVSLQGLGVPPLLPSDVLTYAPLLY